MSDNSSISTPYPRYSTHDVRSNKPHLSHQPELLQTKGKQAPGWYTSMAQGRPSERVARIKSINNGWRLRVENLCDLAE